MSDHAPTSQVVFVREDDPSCQVFEQHGHTITGQSWAANFRLAETSGLTTNIECEQGDSVPQHERQPLRMILAGRELGGPDDSLAT